MKILIINSKKHWINGWMTSAKSLETVVHILQKTGCQIKTIEVQAINELEEVLEGVDTDTLVWANAYWVNGKNGKQYALSEQIEKYDLPFLGSSLKTLLKLLEKDTCQEILRKSEVPIPNYFIIDQNNVNQSNELITNSTLSFPLVIKPTKESRSQGVTKVNNKEEAITTVTMLLHKYPESNIIIEEFLPTNDITCGFLQLGNEIMLLPSYKVVKGMDCSTDIFSEAHYNLPPPYEHQEIIHDSNILSQLQKNIPIIVDSLGIGGITRADARLDKNGVLKFFDINGMPGLNYPTSVLINQCTIHFPNYSKDYLFECLINTIVLESLQQYNIPVPPLMLTNHLFNLESETIIKTNYKIQKKCQSKKIVELIS